MHDTPYPFSFDIKDPWMTKHYVKGNVNYAEVDIFVGAVFPEEYYLVSLTEDGLAMRYRKATPEMFGKIGRLESAMGRKWHEDDSRVVAHDDVVQIIRRKNKPVHLMNWGNNDCLLIPLPFKCVKKIKKDWHQYQTGVEIRKSRQYVSVLTCRIEAAEQRIQREKKGRVSVHDGDPTPGHEQESDSDDSSRGDID